MARVTRYRTDPDLCEVLVTRSTETLQWMRRQGLRFVPSSIHTFNVGGRRMVWAAWPWKLRRSLAWLMC